MICDKLYKYSRLALVGLQFISKIEFSTTSRDCFFNSLEILSVFLYQYVYCYVEDEVANYKNWTQCINIYMGYKHFKKVLYDTFFEENVG